MSGFVLAIDQGTTSSRAIIFDGAMKVVASSQKEFRSTIRHPAGSSMTRTKSGKASLSTCREALKTAELEADEIAAIGITNQRETVVIWDKATGEPIHNAIVWQDRRTSALCQRLKRQGLEKKFSQKTGLLLDPYFSGTKIAWLLDNVKGARRRAERGELLAGTIDSFLIWRLTGGQAHVTDATNASRTLVYNIVTNQWDAELLKILRIPADAAAGGEGLRRRFRGHRKIAVRRRDPDPRRCRRPAGGDDRTGLLPARHDEVDLWHRLLCHPQHRRRHRALEEPAADHHRLSAGRQDDLCAGRLDLRGGRCRAMAARRHEGDRQGGA